MQRKRDVLLLLRGDVGDNRPKAFSGGLRQEVRAKGWGGVGVLGAPAPALPPAPR